MLRPALDEGPGNRRRHPRIAVNLATMLITNPEGMRTNGRLTDLAAGGARLTAPAPLAVGTPVRLEFVMMAKRLCAASGRVVWSAAGDADSAEFGIEFEEVGEPMQRFVHNLSRLSEHLRPLFLADVQGCQLSVV